MGITKRPPRRLKHQTGAGSEEAQVNSSEPDFLIVGQIIRPHGVRGEMAMKILTDYPEHLADVETFYLGESFEPFSVERLRRASDGMLVQVQSVHDRDQAEVLRGVMVRISLDDAIPLADGEVYLYQIQGIQVVTDTGEALGRLTGLIETGANDVYVVRAAEGKEILLPAIPEVVLKIDVEKQVMTVHLMEGLVQ